jgi:hypothetical protein
MMATRYNQSALLKSRLDQLDYRLKELEAAAADLRAMIHVDTSSPPSNPSYYLAPHPKPERGRPRLPHLKRSGQVPKKAAILSPSSSPPPPKIIRRRRSTKFTPEVLGQIKLWVAEGLARDKIAERLGTTPGSLQVSCWRRGISLRVRRRREVTVVREEEAA